MIDNNIDYVQYSWFNKGYGSESIKFLEHYETKNLVFLDYSKDNLQKRKNWYVEKNLKNKIDWLVCMQSILSKNFFYKLITKEENFTMFSKYVPFEFEKKITNTKWLPYKLGVLKKEFFCSIDDDHVIPESSLISRGAYKNRLNRDEMLDIRRQNQTSIYNFIGRIYYSKFLEFFKNLLRF